jgi:hypothetical protein
MTFSGVGETVVFDPAALGSGLAMKRLLALWRVLLALAE